MNRAIATILIILTTVATVPAAIAAPSGRDCGDGSRKQACPGSRSERNHERRETPIRRDDRNDQRGNRQTENRRPGRDDSRSRGHAPTAAQRKRLPKAPPGQQYRVIDNRIVRIDSDTLKTVAVLGLIWTVLD